MAEDRLKAVHQRAENIAFRCWCTGFSHQLSLKICQDYTKSASHTQCCNAASSGYPPLELPIINLLSFRHIEQNMKVIAQYREHQDLHAREPFPLPHGLGEPLY